MFPFSSATTESSLIIHQFCTTWKCFKCFLFIFHKASPLPFSSVSVLKEGSITKEIEGKKTKRNICVSYQNQLRRQLHVPYLFRIFKFENISLEIQQQKQQQQQQENTHLTSLSYPTNLMRWCMNFLIFSVCSFDLRQWRQMRKTKLN